MENFIGLGRPESPCLLLWTKHTVCFIKNTCLAVMFVNECLYPKPNCSVGHPSHRFIIASLFFI